MPVRKSFGTRVYECVMATTGTPAGFTYIGFPRGGLDPLQDTLSEVSLVSGETAAKTVRMVHYNSAGTVVDDVTTASFTPVVGRAVDGTLSTNTVNTGVNFPWTLAPGDSVLVTAVSAGSVNATFTVYPKGT